MATKDGDPAPTRRDTTETEISKAGEAAGEDSSVSTHWAETETDGVVARGKTYHLTLADPEGNTAEHDFTTGKIVQTVPSADDEEP